MPYLLIMKKQQNLKLSSAANYRSTLQAWNADLQLSAKGKNYALYKTNLNPESYLTKLHGAHLINMLKFRTCNHKLPAESGRWNNIEFADRKCELCTKNDIGDNYHYLLSFFELYFFLFFPLANSVYPNEMPHNAAFHLGLHCLP